MSFSLQELVNTMPTVDKSEDTVVNKWVAAWQTRESQPIDKDEMYEEMASLGRAISVASLKAAERRAAHELQPSDTITSTDLDLLFEAADKAEIYDDMVNLGLNPKILIKVAKRQQALYDRASTRFRGEVARDNLTHSEHFPDLFLGSRAKLPLFKGLTRSELSDDDSEDDSGYESDSDVEEVEIEDISAMSS
jgi:hypothetical protein